MRLHGVPMVSSYLIVFVPNYSRASAVAFLPEKTWWFAGISRHGLMAAIERC